jgi:hypothetical protein
MRQVATCGRGWPVTKGYIEFGSDGGHQGGSTWLQNAEALGASVGEQRKHDVTMEVARLYYGRT